MIQATTEQRYALTITAPQQGKQTLMYAVHAVMMARVNDYLALDCQIVSVETLESAIRADAIARGQW